MEADDVLAANATFYAAFCDHDLATMDDLWARTRVAVCIHPGWPPLRGRDAVMASWRTVLTNPASPRVRCLGAEAYVLGDVALVVCIEALRDGPLTATNVFVREDGAWRLALHHAGPIAKGGAEEDLDFDASTAPSWIKTVTRLIQ